MIKPTVLPVPAVDRDLLDHWRSVTDDNGSLVFADRLEEIGEGERAELVRVTVEIKRFPAVRDRNCKYGLPGEYVGPVDGHDAMRGDPCGRCNPSCRTLVKRRNDLESRLSVWPCKDCAGHPGLVDGPPGEWRYTATTCPACGGSGDLLRQTTQAGILAPQFPPRWRAGYPYAATLLTLADAVRVVPGAPTYEPSEVKTHCGRPTVERSDSNQRRGGHSPRWCPACMTAFLPRHAGFAASDFEPTPRLRALCDPERPPPWGVLLEAVMVEDREPLGYEPDEWLWYDERGNAIQPLEHWIPPPVWDLMDLPVHKDMNHCKVAPTLDAAKLALGVTLVALARG